MSFRIQADGLVLATRGGLVLAAELFRTVDVLREGLSPQPATSNFQRARTIIPERRPSFKGVVDFQYGDDTPSSHP
jgi:hypothetical protein